MTMTFVVAGCPIRNRAWVARRHALALAAQTRRPDSLLYIFNGVDDPIDVPDPESGGVIVDRTPTVHGLLSTIPEWMAPGPSGLEPPGERRFLIEQADHIEITGGDQRIEDPSRGLRKYAHADLAALRNHHVERFLAEFPEATHLWSCDSDVIPNPDVLEVLLSAERAIVGAVVPANSDGTAHTFMCGYEPGDLWSPRRNGTELARLRGTIPFSATLVGACVLIRRDVLEAGIRYADAPKCEDEGFAVNAAKGGWWMYVHPLARTAHAQPDGSLWVA